MTDALEELQLLLDRHIAGGQVLRVLEAGCGSMSKVRLPADAYIVGIDISAKQLERNSGLDARILGDIETYPLPEGSFDIIICWDVLEHLPSPEKALKNFFRAARPGGLIVLAFPNLLSLKGLITKLTPHFIHVWYYRYLLHVPDAGLNDTCPFVTYLRLTATYPAIRKMASRHGASVAMLGMRESNDMRYVRDHFWPINVVMKTAGALSRAVSMGRINAMDSDCVLVLRAGSLCLAPIERGVISTKKEAHAAVG